MTPPQTRVELAGGLGVADSRMQRSSGHGAGWKEMTEDGGHQQRAGGRSAGRRSLAVGVFTAQEEGFDFGDVPWRRKRDRSTQKQDLKSFLGCSFFSFDATSSSTRD